MHVHTVGDLWNPLVQECLQTPQETCDSLVTFLTTWALLVHVAAVKHPCIQGVSVLLAISISALGSYLTYVHPKRLVLPVGSRHYVLTGPALWVGDVLLHQLPLWILMSLHLSKKPQSSAYAPAFAMLCVYLIVFNVEEKYGVTKDDVPPMLLITFAAIMYTLSNANWK